MLAIRVALVLPPDSLMAGSAAQVCTDVVVLSVPRSADSSAAFEYSLGRDHLLHWICTLDHPFPSACFPCLALLPREPFVVLVEHGPGPHPRALCCQALLPPKQSLLF